MSVNDDKCFLRELFLSQCRNIPEHMLRRLLDYDAYRRQVSRAAFAAAMRMIHFQFVY